MLVTLTVFLGIVMVRIINMDTSVPVSSTDIEAAARTNERLIQIIQWAITTVLGLERVMNLVDWCHGNETIPHTVPL